MHVSIDFMHVSMELEVFYREWKIYWWIVDNKVRSLSQRQACVIIR